MRFLTQLLSCLSPKGSLPFHSCLETLDHWTNSQEGLSEDPLTHSAAAATSLQSCPTLCDPPGSSIHRILQARILEWDVISFSNACMHAKSLQLCPTLCDPMDSSPPGSSVHRILQARILEWVAISFSRPILRKSDILMEAALSWMEKEELDMQ